MGKLTKFENEEVVIPKKAYKKKADEKVSDVGINLFDLEEQKKESKSSITIYFKNEDLDLLKAVAQLKNITVNKMVNNIISTTIDKTKENLPDDFDVKKLVKKYDDNKKYKGKKTNNKI